MSKPREINVVSVAAMKQLIQSLSEQGFDEAELVAAHSLLPPGNILYEAPGLVLGRLAGRGFALDPALGRDVLIGITDAHPEIEIHGAQVARAMGRTAQGAGAGSLEALLVQLASWADSGRSFIRLRQGAFEARRQVDMAGFGRWKFPAALAAGFGELGKHGSIICPEFGASFRLSAVLTDAPLPLTEARSHGIDDFCNACRICEDACPVDALAPTKKMVRGTLKWYVDFDRCLPFFNEHQGCSICIAVCPWSRPGVGPNLAAKLARRSAGLKT